MATLKKSPTSNTCQRNVNNNTMRHSYVPTRKTEIKKMGNPKYWGGCGETEPSDTAGGRVSCFSCFGKTFGRIY